jgi:metallo-beta-lactamase family protein
VKIFADSPLAVKSSAVFEKYWQHLNPDAQAFYQEHGELFDFKNLHYVENMKESKMLKDYHEPMIIISSSGMVSGGRVEYHVRTNIGNPYCTILMIGYAAEGTLGHRLMNGAKTIRVNNRDLNVQANILRTDVFSGHGDLDDLIQFVEYQDSARTRVFLVHGDESSIFDFRLQLEARDYNVEAPFRGQTFEL